MKLRLLVVATFTLLATISMVSRAETAPEVQSAPQQALEQRELQLAMQEQAMHEPVMQEPMTQDQDIQVPETPTQAMQETNSPEQNVQEGPQQLADLDNYDVNKISDDGGTLTYFPGGAPMSDNKSQSNKVSAPPPKKNPPNTGSVGVRPFNNG